MRSAATASCSRVRIARARRPMPRSIVSRRPWTWCSPAWMDGAFSILPEVSSVLRGPRTLSIVVSAYNEAHNGGGAGDTIMRAGAVLEDFEILLIDDGSSDDTAQVVDRLAANHS